MKTYRLFFTFIFLYSYHPLAYPFAVSTGSPWATEAAIQVIKKGGNAIDAMVTASFVQNITQPYKMGIGGGGFFLTTHKGKIYYWDGREQAPQSANEKMFLKEDGTEIPDWPDRVTGPNPIGIPGMLAGLHQAHKTLGSLPWKSLVQPAIELANKGFPITEKFEAELEENWERLRLFSTSVAIFGDKQGHYLKRGYTLRQPQLAQTLKTIAEDGAKTFYEGKLGESWTNETQKLGVKITTQDLKNYKVRTSTPIHFDVFGLKGYTAPPPSSAGVMVAATLRYLEHYYKSHPLPQPDSAKRILVTSEALSFFQELRNEKLADLNHTKLDPQKFLNSPEEKQAWEALNKKIALQQEKIETKFTHKNFNQPPILQLSAYKKKDGHTAHLSIVDNQGNAVSYTTTIEAIFGSAITVPKHGFLLNNELSDFKATPGHPNSPAPDKRPRSNMSPLLLFEKNKLVGVLGCAGGGLIPTTIVEILENYHLHKMSAKEAIAFPRFHPRQDALELEKALPQTTLDQLKLLGYKIEVSPTLWAVAEIILKRSSYDPWEAAAEPRYDGLALSF